MKRRVTGPAALIGLLAFLASAAAAAVAGMPRPVTHDEFAYVFAGQTFASGRLTNPTPPSPRHFESFHLLVEPSYVSKYPPAQGVVLAIGERLFGEPVVGVWLSVAFLCVAIYWMLLAWVPPAWAVAGGAIAVLQFAGASYWAQSYWGGAVAGAGGALLYGGIRRWVARPGPGSGLALGVGLAILANSRPLEGLLISLPVAALLGVSFLRADGASRRLRARTLIAAVMVLAPTAALMGYYNWRTTGSAVQLPYLAHAEQYQAGEIIHSGSDPATFPNSAFRRFHEEHVIPVMEHRSSVRNMIRGALAAIVFLIGPGVLALIALRRVLADRWMILAVSTCVALLSVGVVSLTAMHPHYFAPVAGLCIAVAVTAVREVMGFFADPRTAVRAAALLAGAWVAVFAVKVVWNADRSVAAGARFAGERERITAELRSIPGEDLVFVDYGARHNILYEWVYNEPELRSASIVWARDLGEPENRQLLSAFANRRAWRLTIDDEVILVPLAAAAGSADRRAQISRIQDR